MSGSSETGRSKSARAKWHLESADVIAIVAVVISAITALFAWYALNTDREALHANSQAAIEAERTTLFLQFEEQYYPIAARFPKQLHEPKFQPDPSTDDYARLQAYWFFCFAEWYATHRVNPTAFGDLWDNYYAPLVATGLKIPSLRYVLEAGVRTHGVGRGDWTAFLRDLASIAKAHGQPLDSDVLRGINGAQVTQIRITDVSLASQRVHPRR